MSHSFHYCSVPSRLVLTTILILVAASGCGKKEVSSTAAPQPAKATIVSAEKTSFHEVTAQLDPGGSVYGYLSTSQWLEGLSDRVNSWREAVLSLPDLGDEGRSNLTKAFDLATRLIKNCGVESITGVGVSGIALEKGFYQTKFVAQRDTNVAPGGIWTVFGRAPRPLQELDWLPAETVCAAFSDLEIGAIWNALVREVDGAGFTEAKAGLDRLNSAVQEVSGKNLDEWFGSLGGHGGAFLTLNDSNKVSIPLPNGGTLEIGEPGLVVVLKVKDDLLFDWIDRTLQANPQVIHTDEGALRMRTMPLPLPVPLTLRPSIARQGEYLYLASNDGLVKDIMAVKAGKRNGLKTTAEFKRLAQGMPPEGNSFSFVSQRLGDAMQQIQASIVNQARGQGNEAPALLLRKISSAKQPVSSFVVGGSTGRGWITVGHGTQQPANAILLPLVVAPTAIIAGMTLPALAKAKSKAQSISCVNNLKQMGLAALIYSSDHNGAFPPDFVTMKDQLNTPKILICPAAPNHGISATVTWANFEPSLGSYEFLGGGLSSSTPGNEKKVLFRCRIHGHVCLGDGHVEMRNSASK